MNRESTLVRVLTGLIRGIVGSAVGALAAAAFMTAWTVVFSGVPLEHVWRHTGEDASYALLAYGVVAAGGLVGFGIGFASGLRRPTKS